MQPEQVAQRASFQAGRLIDPLLLCCVRDREERDTEADDSDRHDRRDAGKRRERATAGAETPARETGTSVGFSTASTGETLAAQGCDATEAAGCNRMDRTLVMASAFDQDADARGPRETHPLEHVYSDGELRRRFRGTAEQLGDHAEVGLCYPGQMWLVADTVSAIGTCTVKPLDATGDGIRLPGLGVRRELR